jgi:hypothetical protein
VAGWKEVICVLGDFDSAANGEFLEGFSKVFPIMSMCVFVPGFLRPVALRVNGGYGTASVLGSPM